MGPRLPVASECSDARQCGHPCPRLDEISKLAPIEEDADRRYLDTRFHEFAVTSGIPADVAARYIAEDRLLVAAIEDEPVVFIGWHTEVDATVLGISQVSVLTTFGRQGIGTSLIEAVMLRARAEGYRSVVLATQIDVPWNESWYRRLGFESVQPDDWTDWMRAGAADQQSDGIDWTDRVWMTRDLS